MAVYGKHRDKWNPRKQSKAKVSKNRTIAWAKTADSTPKLKDFLWCHVSIDGEIGTIQHINGNLSADTAPTVTTTALSVLGTSSNLTDSPVTSARFEPTGTGFVSGSRLCFSNNLDFTERDYWTENGDYKYVSLWLKLDQQHAGAGSDGHSIMAIGRSRTDSHDESHEFDPWLSISTNSTRQVSIGLSSVNTATTGTTYNRTGGSKKVDVTYFTSASSVTDRKWHHVLFAFDNSSGESCKIYIDGSLATNGSISGSGTYPLANRNTTTTCSLRVGNKCGGYSTIDTTTIEADAGFDGSAADFMMFTLEQAPDDVARIVYEASREGVHALHSGIHNSSPRLEQLDLDRDSLYPPSHSLDSYTKFEDTIQYGANRDIRVSLKTTGAFQEGAITDPTLSSSYDSSDPSNYPGQVETWQEKAGKYHIQSTISGGTETVTIMPHTRLNPSDTILTNGNWYSDARSEFFPADLDATTGFVISNVNDAATIKHIPVVSDELYREHSTSESVKPFVDADMSDDFKDCFVIEIPLPHIGGSLKLSTDAEDIDASVKEIAERKFNSADVAAASTVDPVQKINTMAYYNFKDKKWEHTVPSYSTYAPDGLGGSLEWTGTGDIGFSPMSGLVLPKHGKNLDYFSSLYGKPMTDCGFPFHKKFESEVGQTIDLSKYLDESVILEGWEIHCDVIPRTGYSHNATNGSIENTEDGYKLVYGADFNNSTSKSPLYYGATGEAAVFWDPDGGETIPFYQKGFGSGTAQFRFDNTIPVSNFTTSSSINFDGTEKITVTENKPTRTSKGLVTKGVTAFLLKETDLYDKSLQREKWLRSQPRLVAGSANDLAADYLAYDYTRAQGLHGDIGKYHEVPDSSINSFSATSVYGRRQPPLSYEFYEPNTARYTRGSSREMIGYLQQVYHNDISGSVDRQYWTREHSSTLNGIVPNWRDQNNIIESLNKENNTYVANLLRENTAIYPLNLSGSCKIQTPYAGSFPISNFKIAGSTGTALGVYKHNSSAAAIDIYHSYAVIPSSEGSTFSDMVQHDTVPNIRGKSKSVSITLPESVYPCAVPTSAASAWPTTALSPFDISIPENEDCDVVLRPTDKLILGIQDSISTCFASQQIQHNASGAEFVRWGRNYLEMPNSQNGYLRLYVKRTRDDKTFNVIADSSSYSANVNRDLGDQLVSDKYLVNPPLMYSGSMADDIMGPTTFTPPIMQINVDASGVTGDAVSGGFHETNYDWSSAINSPAQSGAGNWATIASAQQAHDAIDKFNIPWNQMSHQAFKNRGESVTPRYPAIDWKDASNSTGNDGQWYNCSNFYHWPLAKAGTDTTGSNASWDLAAPTGSTDFRFRNYAKISELNTNSGATATGHVVLTGGHDVSLVGYDSPGMSAWNFNVLLPIYRENSSNVITPVPTIIKVEVRTVKILNANYTTLGGTEGAAGNYARVPEYSDGTPLAVGDAFYFDDNQDAIKLNLSLDPAGDIPENQKFLRNWLAQRNSNVGPLVYVVAAKITNSAGSPYDVLSSPKLTFKNVYSIISRLLYIHTAWDNSVLGNVSSYWGAGVTTLTGTEVTDGVPQGHDGSFLIGMPESVTLRETFEQYKTAVNDMMAFKLCGVTINADSVVGAGAGSVIDNNIRFWKSGAPLPLTLMHFNSTISGGMLSNVNTTHTIERTNYISEYFRLMSITDAAAIHNGTAAAAGGTKLSKTMYQIDYTNITRSAPLLEITSETYTPQRRNAIDRFVQRRSSELYNSTDATKPLVPGPFGSLKNFYTMTSSNTIHDSLPAKDLASKNLTGYCPTYEHKTKVECNAHVGTGHTNVGGGTSNDWVETNYMTLVTDVPQNFPFENSDERLAQVRPRNLKINMKTAASGGRAASNTTTVEYTENTGDTTVGNYNWGFSGASTSVFTVGSTGLINVTNYIQDGFKGNSNFTNKTVSDLLIGFGNGVQSKHQLRPGLYDFVAWTGSNPVKFSIEYIIDKPRGARFGQSSTVPMFGTYKFSYTHFGHLRDMQEQSIDTKFINHASNERVFGAPVVVNAINITNPEIPKLMTNTSRYNKTINATVTKPYIEDNYEAIKQPVNLESETLRVDVAGAIRSNRVLAPGSISSNIRSR